MNETNNLITSIFSGALESRQLEFKEGFNWEFQESAKMREELIKAILSMSNTPNGGAIILGIRTDTKKKAIFPEGLIKKDADSFIKNVEQIKTVIHGYCQRPVDFDLQTEVHPANTDRQFIIFQVAEFSKWPTITVKPGKIKENNGKLDVIENHAIYTRSKLAQWSSIKAGPQEIEDIIEAAVKKYDTHIRSLGYVKVRPIDKEIETWFNTHHIEAINGLKGLDIQTFMEVKAKFISPDQDFKKIELREAARESTIPTFGWPIAVFLDNRDDYRPVSDTEGIKAEISMERHVLDKSRSYDYWAIHTSGAFYILKSIFEDMRDPEILSFNTRVVRITEVFMYLKNLYSNLGIEPKKEFKITFAHCGIKGRRLGTLSQNRLMLGTSLTHQNEVLTSIITSVDKFTENPSDVVEKITDPLFEAFDFYKVDRKILEQIVNDYLNGRVT